ncbi:2'-5'-oligoadenylate synthase 1-like [Branchiostoma lanceolatum]|uniref:2'-5'-oligoadenylate synthase 1-like n=1 Tax=Branchiostoma lanceolatum TaxID=7740 RepID=UPI0034567EA5
MAHFSGDASFLNLTSERELNAHIDRELQMTESDRTSFNRVLDGLYRTLQTEVRYNSVTVNRLVKGGSYGRGTALKDRSDLDVTLFLNGITSMRDFLNQQQDIIGRVAATLEGSRWARENGVVSVVAQQNAATLVLRSRDHQMEVDIVPAYDNLGAVENPMKRNEVYQSMRGQDPYKYSASFVGLQVEFVREKPARLKNLIRLVKSWKKAQDARFGRKLGSSWLWELISIYVCETKVGSTSSFNMKQAFKMVMETVVNYSSLRALWTTYYSDRFPVVREKLSSTGSPLVLDPANPWDNVADRCNHWCLVDQAAREALQSPLLQSW